MPPKPPDLVLYNSDSLPGPPDLVFYNSECFPELIDLIFYKSESLQASGIEHGSFDSRTSRYFKNHTNTTSKSLAWMPPKPPDLVFYDSESLPEPPDLVFYSSECLQASGIEHGILRGPADAVIRPFNILTSQPSKP